MSPGREVSRGHMVSVSPSDQEAVMTPPGPRRPGLVSVRTPRAPVDTGEGRTGGPGRVLSGAGAGAAIQRRES